MSRQIEAKRGEKNLQSGHLHNSSKSFIALSSFTPGRGSSPAVNGAEQISPWLKLEEGRSAETTFYGKAGDISAMRNNLATPAAQTSADINADGYPDLISGFRNAAGGGLIALHRANKEAFEPHDAEVLANLKQGVFPAAFEKDAMVIEVPVSPDFIFSGKFTQNSAVEVVLAARGGHSIYLLTPNETGGFDEPREIAVGGAITALTAGIVDLSGAGAGVVAAVSGDQGFRLLIFDGVNGLDKTVPHSVPVDRQVDSLTLANTNGAQPSISLYGLSDGGIFTVSGLAGRNGTKSRIDRIELPFRATDFAVGEFIRDRQAKPEIAVLSDDGVVTYLANGALDTRPFTTEEIRAQWQENGGRGVPSSKIGAGTPQTKTELREITDDWQVTEEHALGINSFNRENSMPLLQRARITGNETDDLLLVDRQNNRVDVLFKEPLRDAAGKSLTGETKRQSLSLSQNPAAVLPMRLNVMGQQGFVVFSRDSLEPTPVIFAPNAGFAVTKTADSNDGVCNADCSLREAVIAANTSAGTDIITFNVNGIFQLTIAGAGENASATGDLDITQALTITGNGTAQTILQAGTNTTNGIDKVLSINPLFNAAFATSLSGLTVRFGRNPSSFSTDGFGGGFDWEGSGTGTLSVTGSNVTDNRTVDGDGGGITATNSTAGAGTFTVSNTAVANNIPARVGASSPIGGGMFVGQSTPFFLTNVVVNNNSVSGSSGQGSGGGIYAFGPSGAGGKSFLTGTTVTSNSAPVDGGGINTTQPVDINPGAIISNNTAGRWGGGIYVNTAGTAGISKATLTGNSATTSGGAIHLGTSTTSNILNVSYSRIAGNTAGTFSGLVTAGGTANVENNWWGCNTGPAAAPCDTAGSTAGTVDFNPWLRFTYAASPNPITIGQATTLTASFLTNSAGSAIAASDLTVLTGVSVAHGSAVRGVISSPQTTIQAGGTATAIFTANSVGAGSATATIDSGTAVAAVTINAGTVAVVVTADHNPALVGQTVILTATVTPQSPSGSVTPVGTVQFRDGGTALGGAVTLSNTNPATATLSTSALTAGNHTITADFTATDGNFGSVTGTALTSNPLVITNTDTWTGATSNNWNTVTNWNTGAIPAAANDVVIPAAGVTSEPTISAGSVTVNNLTVAAGRTLTINSGLTLTVNGTSSISGNIVSAGTFAPTGTVTYNGTAAQTGAGGTYANLTISNAAGVTIPGNATVNGTLTLTSGNLTVSSPNVLTIAAAGTISRTSGYVLGNLRKNFTAAGTFTFPVGTANGYSPVTDQVTAGTGNLTVASVQGPEPTLNPATSLQRYWTLTGTGITSNLTFSYLAADVAGNETNYRIVRVSGGVPTVYPATAPNTTTHQATISGVSSYSNWTLSQLGPTAAQASISGRVTADGKGVANARVELTGPGGATRVVMTNAFGNFNIFEVETGTTYLVKASAKRYAFAPQVVSLTENISGLTFTAQ